MIVEKSIAPRMVSGLVPFWAAATPNAPALTDSRRRWNYAELDETIRKAATVLSERGVRRGDRLLIVCENHIAAVLFYFACTMLRAWPVIVNARLSGSEVEEIRRHCGARLLLFTTDGSLHAQRHAHTYGALADDVAGFPGVMFGPVDDQAAPEPEEAEPENEVAALIYTSGTTGRPKGVMLSHRNLLFAATGAAKARHLSSGDRILSVLPISHILGLSGVLLGSFASGAEVQLLARFEPASLLQRLEAEGTSILIGTPAMYAMITEYAARKGIARIRAPMLRILSTAGAPLDPSTKANTEAVFGQPLRNGYGITECSPTITLPDVESPPADCGVGRALPGIQARLMNASGEIVPDNEVGELWVRGPGVMKGYYRAPDETARAIDSDGWFRTGDLVRVQKGNFYVVGRAKEMVIRFGFNVYPAEVESALNAHPMVTLSAVMGSQGTGGEELTAFVEPRNGSSLTSDELGDYVSTLLAPYKRPSRYVIVGALPLSPAGKVIKSELAAQLVQPSR